MKIKIFTLLMLIFSLSNVFAGDTISVKELKEKALSFAVTKKIEKELISNENSDIEDILKKLDDDDYDEIKNLFELKFKELEDLNNKSEFQNLDRVDYFLSHKKLQDTEKSNIKKESKKSNIWLTLFITLLLLNVGAVFFFFYDRKNSKAKKRTNQEASLDIASLNKTKDSPMNDSKKEEEIIQNKLRNKDAEIRELKSKYSNLNNDNKALIEEISKLKASLETKTTQNNKEVEVITEKKEAPDSVSDKPKIYYAKNINSNGYFEMKDLVDFSNDNEFYKITIDKEKAEFEFFNNKYSLKTSLDYINDYIKPFCYETNFIKEPVTSITTVDKGILIKEGNIWKVQTRANIKYD